MAKEKRLREGQRCRLGRLQEGAPSHGMGQPLDNGKDKAADPLLNLQKGTQPCQGPHFGPVGPVLGF